MVTVGLTLKRAFNEAHNHLQDTILPLRAPSVSELPSSLNMPGQPVGGLQSIKRTCSPDYGTFIQSFRDEVKLFLEHFKHVFLLPLSWWLTITHFIMSLIWALMVTAKFIFKRLAG
jgi:hypothetical protein